MAVRRAGLEGVEKVSQAPQRHGHDGAEHWACFACVPHRRIAGRAGYRSWMRVVLVVVAAGESSPAKLLALDEAATNVWVPESRS